MPTYNFNCSKCNRQSTIQCSIDDYKNINMTCDICGGQMLRKIKLMESMGTDGKSNSLSPNNWKIGKSNSQIADIIANKTEPY